MDTVILPALLKRLVEEQEAANVSNTEPPVEAEKRVTGEEASIGVTEARSDRLEAPSRKPRKPLTEFRVTGGMSTTHLKDGTIGGEGEGA